LESTLAAMEDEEADAGPRSNKPGSERLCIVSRTVKPTAEMIRFVAGPDGAVVPDLRRKLPGRGLWVTATKAAVTAATERKAFARGFKRAVRAAPDLPDLTERLLERAALDALGIARKAGLVVSGFAKVDAALAADPVIALIHAADASPDGARKLANAAHRRFADAEEKPVEIDLFVSAQLDLALGRPNVVHAAVLAGPGSAGFVARARSLERFRSDGVSVRGRAAHPRREPESEPNS
jgi:predicted RNA-binding protein YlxR (DUF448 family)